MSERFTACKEALIFLQLLSFLVALHKGLSYD